MDVRIREQSLPGIGHRYDLLVDEDRRLIVVVLRGGRREIGLGRRDSDEPDVVVRLSHDQAVAAAALLTGARFSIESGADERGRGVGDVVVETVTLGEGSPAIGHLWQDVPLLRDSEAAVLAVIRDDTPELVEDGVTQPYRVGDRLVVAVRRDRLDAVKEALG